MSRKFSKICKVSRNRAVGRKVQARLQHGIWSPIDGDRRVSICFSIISKKTGQRCCCRDRFGNFSFFETVMFKIKKRLSPTWRCQIILVFGKYSDVVPVEPIFELFFSRKYAGDCNNLDITHSCLELLHLLLAQNSGTRWQKIAQKTATHDC